MKKLLLFLFVLSLFSCSAKKRAYWYSKRAEELYPPIYQRFDTTISITDTTYIKGDTIRTEVKDTVIIKGKVKVQIKDRILTVTTPSDTIIKEIKKTVQGRSYPVFKDKPFFKERSFLAALVLFLALICVGMFLVISLQIKK